MLCFFAVLASSTPTIPPHTLPLYLEASEVLEILEDKAPVSDIIEEESFLSSVILGILSVATFATLVIFKYFIIDEQSPSF